MKLAPVAHIRHPCELACALTLLTFGACGGGMGGASGGAGGVNGGGTGTGTSARAYTMTVLVSNGAVSAKTVDSNLLNPWGIVFGPGKPVWTANNRSQTSTLYDGNGTKESPTITIPAGDNGPASPTGIVFNDSSGFVISNGHTSAPAQFIFCGEGGTISGWADTVDSQKALTAYDDGAAGPSMPCCSIGTAAVYKGMALAADSSGALHLYAADVKNYKIDEFDSSFNKVTLTATAFIDPTLPAGYAPFNIQAISVNGATLLYVAYAKPQEPDLDPTTGAGLGIVDVFDTQGTFEQHLINPGGKLNAPWGLALAPGNFGAFSGDLLVGNNGDGRINAYDPTTGAFKGSLSDASGQPIVNLGLWGIAFGNGADNQPTTTLFVAAGPDNEADGVYGRIDLAQ